MTAQFPQSTGLRVSGSGLRVADLGFGVLGVGLRVEGWGLGAARDQDQGLCLWSGARMKGVGLVIIVES